MDQAAAAPWTDQSDADIGQAADRILAFDGEVDQPTVRSICDGARIAWVDDPGMLSEPKLAFLLRHWQSLRGPDGSVPDRHAVDALDLVPAIGNLMVLEAERDGFDAIYRLYGTAIATDAGRDWTGFRVSELNRATKAPASLLFRACYRAVSLRPAPLFTEHAPPSFLGVGLWRRLILPLADGDIRCARFLVGTIATDVRVRSGAERAEVKRRSRPK